MSRNGDPFRDKIRDKLDYFVEQYNIPWRVADTQNGIDNPDSADPYITLEFLGGSEDQATFGAPGDNLYEESGQINIKFVFPLMRSISMREAGERYAKILRDAFRGIYIPLSEGREIAIDRTLPLGDGLTEGGNYTETVGMDYRLYNVG